MNVEELSLDELVNSLPKLFRVADDMHSMVGYLNQFRLLTFALVALGLFGSLVFALIRCFLCRPPLSEIGDPDDCGRRHSGRSPCHPCRRCIGVPKCHQDQEAIERTHSSAFFCACDTKGHRSHHNLISSIGGGCGEGKGKGGGSHHSIINEKLSHYGKNLAPLADDDDDDGVCDNPPPPSTTNTTTMMMEKDSGENIIKTQ